MGSAGGSGGGGAPGSRSRATNDAEAEPAGAANTRRAAPPRGPLGTAPNGGGPLGPDDLGHRGLGKLYGLFRGALAGGRHLPVGLVAGCPRKTPITYVVQMEMFRGWVPTARIAFDLHVQERVVQRWSYNKKGYETSPDARWVRADPNSPDVVWQRRLRKDWSADPTLIDRDLEFARRSVIPSPYYADPPVKMRLWDPKVALEEARDMAGSGDAGSGSYSDSSEEERPATPRAQRRERQVKKE